MRSDARLNTDQKPYAVIQVFGGAHVGGTLLEEHADGTATIEWARGPWRGKLISKRPNHPRTEE